jgi:MFS family permease
MTVLTNTWRVLRGNFDPLRLPNFRLYLGGQAVSLVGTWLQITAQAWVVWELTGSTASLGIVSMLNALPLLLFGLYAGVWVDRVDRRRLLIGTQVSAMLLAFILAFLIQTKLIQLWHVYVLSFLLGTVGALDFPAQQAFLGELAGMADVRKAVNLNITILQISRILGPALAGLVIARVGIAPAFWLNGLSFLAVIASLVVVRAAQQIQKSRSDISPTRQVIEGFAYLKSYPRLQDLYMFSIVLTFFFFSIMNIMPAVADKVLGGDAVTLGLLLSSSGVGALVGVLIIVPIAQSVKHAGPIMLGSLFWLVIWLSVLAHSHSLPLSMLAICLASVGAPTVMTMAMGLVQVMSPLDMRGRLISLFTMISFGMAPLSALWIGWTAQVLGVENAIQLNAILMGAGAAVMLLFRREIFTFVYGTPAAVRAAPCPEPGEVSEGETEGVLPLPALQPGGC